MLYIPLMLPEQLLYVDALHPCTKTISSRSCQLRGDTSMDWMFWSSTCHRCSIGLRSEGFGGQGNTLNYLSCSTNHSCFSAIYSYSIFCVIRVDRLALTPCFGHPCPWYWFTSFDNHCLSWTSHKTWLLGDFIYTHTHTEHFWFSSLRTELL